MAPTQPCASYQYVVTSNGPKILPVEEQIPKDEESPADYNSGGYLQVKVGDTFKHGRYRVVRKLGWGHFSTVWLVKDLKLKHHSALKVVKSAGRYAETARDEIKLLSRVAAANLNHPGRSHVVSFLDSFAYEGIDAAHVCIVFEPLGENLLAIIERHKKTGVPTPVVRSIAKQILLGLQYLHDECDLVHTDIKPENILISIPDVEEHILDELAQSPTPTSRRVGVPPPPKNRVGVVIPQGQPRSRRQVQIFESQPLSSPKSSRSIGRHGPNSLSMSTSARPGYPESVPSSMPGSFAQMHISRLTSSSGLSGTTCAKPSSPDAPKPLDGTEAVPSPSVKPVSDHTSPSTSSSSSSLNSALEYSNAGTSSIISTPPTSLSNSIGNVVSGFINLSKATASIPLPSKSLMPGSGDPQVSTKGIAIKGKKATSDAEDETSSSWKSNLSLPSSFTDKLSSSLSSSFKSSRSGHGRSKLNQVHNNSDQPVNGASASHWKHPGTAAPAPAVVVSAVAAPDGMEVAHHVYDFSETCVVPAHTSSEASSTTATTAQPSRTTTPVESSSQKPTPVRHNSPKAKSVADSINTHTALPSAPSQVKAAPSLLTQTAPTKLLKSKRPTPSTNNSQLTVNTRESTDSEYSDHSAKRTKTKSKDITLPVPIPSGATPPAPPPPTPVESPLTSATSTILPNSASALLSTPAPINVPSYNPPELPALPEVFVKIADLGNATPSKKHYTEEIQTRQYRAPEAILGRRDWDTRADIWSVACVIFELLTAEYLFDPHGQGEHFSKDDDHMAQIIELVGDFSLEAKMGGKYSREIFDHTGALRYIRSLKPWPLKRVMIEKYVYSEANSDALCEFLVPMLEPDMKKRARARDLLDHQWLRPAPDDELITEW